MQLIKKIFEMKKYLILLLFVASAMVFASCSKECTCSMWTGGKNTDTNPRVYTQEEISNLSISKCTDLDDYYDGIGLGYDESTGNGIRCK